MSANSQFFQVQIFSQTIDIFIEFRTPWHHPLDVPENNLLDARPLNFEDIFLYSVGLVEACNLMGLSVCGDCISIALEISLQLQICTGASTMIDHQPFSIDNISHSQKPRV